MADWIANLCHKKKCPICGKTFYIPTWMYEGYTYKVRNIGHETYKYYCSYSCYSKNMNEQNKKLKSKKEMVCK